jgi:cell division protein FtsQ
LPVNAEAIHTPAVRSWRDIPQPVKPRAMSRGGRWRRAMQGLRVVALVACGGLLAAGVWFLIGTVSWAPRNLPEVAKSGLLRRLELKTSTGGVLDGAWLERTLALPRDVTLMELDLNRLRARLLAEGQVVSAAVAREFPDRLIVRIAERTPVARVRVEAAGKVRDLLVASDGFVFQGEGFDAAMLAGLPWLSGVALAPEGAGFRPIAGMSPVAQLLSDAQFSAHSLYQSWLSVSLARLASDREIEVTTRNGTTIIFNAARDFFVQLATLDYLVEKLANTPMGRARIDLTLGRNVPVMIEPPAPAVSPAAEERSPPAEPATPPPFFSFPPSPNR